MSSKDYIFGTGITITLLLLCELVLRLIGYPFGTFAPLFPPTQGLYYEGVTINSTWGVVPYRIKTNSIGLRGPEINRNKAKGTYRIITIGDSITAGFFVDNEAMWQTSLQKILTEQYKKPTEVVNCALGGGSIGWELALLKTYGIPLKPDIVILTFVTNDISDILDKPISQLADSDAYIMVPKNDKELTRFVLTKIAIGEAFYDIFLRIKSPSYRDSIRESKKKSGDSRYAIEGGDQYAKNARDYMNRFSQTDGLLLGDSFSSKTLSALSNYTELLSQFSKVCEQNGSKLLFVYFPAYPQIYSEKTSLLINKTLRTICDERGIDFLDLTDGFKKRGRNQVLHLAPLDYHLNPKGNEVFAELVAEYFLKQATVQK